MLLKQQVKFETGGIQYFYLELRIFKPVKLYVCGCLVIFLNLVTYCLFDMGLPHDNVIIYKQTIVKKWIFQLERDDSTETSLTSAQY